MKKEEPPLSLYGQLLWREFFYTAATKNPNFDRMYGNPICVQIPWDKNPEVRAEKRRKMTPQKTFQILQEAFWNSATCCTLHSAKEFIELK